ncbi:MAG: hypothetical protein JWN56_1672 [Sphingobacteriales bacterium]|nr:hypothetical protein [Sphingobacteriales bacterium]
MAHKKNKSEKNEKSEIVSEDVDSKEYSVIALPNELTEISGITFLNDSVILAIADEEGVLYYYDLLQNKVIKKQNFGKPDDYEDLVRVGEDLYIVVSNGLIHHIKNFSTDKPELNSFKTPLTGKNNIEGIAFDAKNNRLLLAAKDNGLDDNNKTKEIYSYDLNSGKFQSSPAYTINIENIETQFKGDALEESSKKFLKALGNENMNKVFRPSALTVKPSTNELYVLSSINNLIAVISPKGELSKIIPLTGKDFKQPEGIAFGPDESLYISNEGKSGLGNIIKLKHEE